MPNLQVSTQNHGYYISYQCRNPTYPSLEYYGPSRMQFRRETWPKILGAKQVADLRGAACKVDTCLFILACSPDLVRSGGCHSGAFLKWTSKVSKIMDFIPKEMVLEQSCLVLWRCM